ncbi:MAG: HAD family phosphatase [Lachnospiraceae bacterium]|nr:HAD family phosphatase [Lachnospiraceae bacterium]
MLKGIFFDFDGVITLEKQGTPPMIAYIAEATGLPAAAVEKAYRRHNRALLMGEVTHEEMWQQFCEELETNIDYEILRGAFLNITLDQSMIAHIKELKEKYLIGMITDNKMDRIETILKEKGLEELFDVVVISAQVHCGKTEEKIFAEALTRSGLEPGECVFIDNTAQNLEVPGKMGFRTVYFDDEKRDLAELCDILKEAK